MNNKRNFLIIFLLAFLFLSTGILAQESQNQMQNTEIQTYQDTTQKSPNTQSSLDTINSTESIVVDTAKNTSYQKIARDMTIKLLEKMNISFDQAGDIEKILIDYQEDIAEAKRNGNTNATDPSQPNTDNEMIGGTYNGQNLSEIDKETNEAIEDVLSDDQISTYMFVKEDWWNDLKSQVYGTGTENEQNNIQNQNMDQNNNQDIQQNSDQNEPGQVDQNTQDQHSSPDTGNINYQNETTPDSTDNR